MLRRQICSSLKFVKSSYTSYLQTYSEIYMVLKEGGYLMMYMVQLCIVLGDDCSIFTFKLQHNAVGVQIDYIKF